MPDRPSSSPPDPAPLRPVEFEILLSLAPGDRHGYGIIQETEARTGGAVRLETGTLYRALRRLVDAGLVKPSGPRVDAADERRRNYTITARGRAVAATEAARMARLVASARAVHLLPAREPS